MSDRCLSVFQMNPTTPQGQALGELIHVASFVDTRSPEGERVKPSTGSVLLVSVALLG